MASGPLRKDTLGLMFLGIFFVCIGTYMYLMHRKKMEELEVTTRNKAALEEFRLKKVERDRKEEAERLERLKPPPGERLREVVEVKLPRLIIRLKGEQRDTINKMESVGAPQREILKKELEELVRGIERGEKRLEESSMLLFRYDSMRRMRERSKKLGELIGEENEIQIQKVEDEIKVFLKDVTMEKLSREQS